MVNWLPSMSLFIIKKTLRHRRYTAQHNLARMAKWHVNFYGYGLGHGPNGANNNQRRIAIQAQLSIGAKISRMEVKIVGNPHHMLIYTLYLQL